MAVNEMVLDGSKNIEARSESRSNEIIDEELNEAVGSVPIMEISDDSDIGEDDVNEENEENDGSSLGM